MSFEADSEVDNEIDELDFITNSDIDDEIVVKPTVKKVAKREKKIYVDPVELREEVLKHSFNRKLDDNYVMDRKLALMCMKMIEELYKKGNFRGYHGGWEEEMRSKAYENLIKYIHLYDEDFVNKPYFFINWIFRVHETKLRKLFTELDLDYLEFLDTLPDIKKKFIKKSKDPNKEVKNTYKKISAELLFDFIEKKHTMDVEGFKNNLYSNYPDLQTQFEEYKLRNAFNYVTQIINRSAVYVIKVENKNKIDSQLLNEAILYRTEDLDEDAIENDSRFITFDESKLDYGGFEF